MVRLVPAPSTMKPLSHAQFIEFCVQYASLTLVYYDFVLTFGRELKYVWGRKFHILTVMFLFCRYSTVANIIFAVGLVNKFYGLSCNTAYIVSSSLSVLGRIGVLSILATRTCALFRYNKALIALFTILGLGIVSLSVAHVPYVSCTGAKIKESRIATDMLCVLTVVYEILATVLLAFGCHRNMQAVGSLKEQKGGLMTLMLREGLLYSLFVTSFTGSAMILNYTAPLGSFWQRLLNALTIPISGLMAARFLLHVREWQDRSAGGTESSDQSLNEPFNFSDPSTAAIQTVDPSKGKMKQIDKGGAAATMHNLKLAYLGDDASLASSFASTSSGSSSDAYDQSTRSRMNSIV